MRVIVVASTICLSMAGVSVAQIAPPTAEPSTGLAEIVVTAEKRTERLQDVPSSVSALSGDTLQAMGAREFTDYARSIPGLTFTDSGGGTADPGDPRHPTPRPSAGTVSFYIDEAPIPGAQGSGGDGRACAGGYRPGRGAAWSARHPLWLEAPSAARSGSSPMPRTSTRFEGSVKAEAIVTEGESGASPGAEGELVLNVPVVQGVAAVRTAFWYKDIGGSTSTAPSPTPAPWGSLTGPVVGTVKNIGDEHTWGMRTTGLLQPTEQLKISAMVYLERQHFDGFTDITGGPGNPDNRLVQSFISDTPEPQDNTFDMYNLTVKYDFARFSFLSSTSDSQRGEDHAEEGTSLIQYTPAFFGDAPYGGALANVGSAHFSVYNFSQEARLATSQSIAGFDGVVGAYFSEAHSPLNYPYYPANYNSLVTGNNPADPAYALNGNVYTQWGPGYHERQLAEFGELTYHFTDKLSLTGGMRHYDVANHSLVYQDGLLVGNVLDVTDLSSRAEGNVYKGNLSYKLSPDDLVYVQFSEGFRPGFGRAPLPTECDTARRARRAGRCAPTRSRATRSAPRPIGCSGASPSTPPPTASTGTTSRKGDLLPVRLRGSGQLRRRGDQGGRARGERPAHPPLDRGPLGDLPAHRAAAILPLLRGPRRRPDPVRAELAVRPLRPDDLPRDAGGRWLCAPGLPIHRPLDHRLLASRRRQLRPRPRGAGGARDQRAHRASLSDLGVRALGHQPVEHRGAPVARSQCLHHHPDRRTTALCRHTAENIFLECQLQVLSRVRSIVTMRRHAPLLAAAR